MWVGMSVKHQPYHFIVQDVNCGAGKVCEGEVCILRKHLLAGNYKSMKSDLGGFSAWIC